MSAFEGDIILYYYDGFNGRAMPIKMMLTDAGVPFTLTPPDFSGTRVIPDNEGHPVFAPPAVTIPGDGNLSQTYAQMTYFAEKLGYINEADQSPYGKALVAQLTLDAMDLMGDAYNAATSGDEEKIAAFCAEGGRMEIWLRHIMSILTKYGSKGRGKKFEFAFQSEKPTTADFAIFTAFRFCRFLFGKEAMKRNRWKRIRNNMQHMRRRENFVKPGRPLPWKLSPKGRAGEEDPGADSDDEDDDDDDDEED